MIASCPSCNSPFEYAGGENKEDFCCSNSNCPARVEAFYNPHLGIKNNWWFCSSYHLPFKEDNEWYCLIGGGIYRNTLLQQIIIYERLIYYHPLNIKIPAIQTKTCTQKYLLDIPYYALPSNEDFAWEFKKLKVKAMKALFLK